MSNIDTLKRIEQEYKELFNQNFKELMKDKNKKKRYALALLQASLNLVIKYISEFEKL